MFPTVISTMRWVESKETRACYYASGLDFKLFGCQGRVEIVRSRCRSGHIVESELGKLMRNRGGGEEDGFEI